MRVDQRRKNELRPVRFELHPSPYAEGSVIIYSGKTKVLCTATIEEKVPHHRKESGGGWITAEYAMLPRATNTRNQREGRSNRSGRTSEIQRLIGRSLRAACDLQLLGPRQIVIDCDVLIADGGTRTASITGGYIALELAIKHLLRKKTLEKSPIQKNIQAISVGIVKGEALLDLCYREDFAADVDLNLVMANASTLVEIQGTAEGQTFTEDELHQLVALGKEGCQTLRGLQHNVLAE